MLLGRDASAATPSSASSVLQPLRMPTAHYEHQQSLSMDMSYHATGVSNGTLSTYPHHWLKVTLTKHNFRPVYFLKYGQTS
jgi:hypothetical protein